MDDTEKTISQTAEHKNVLPDVVHSQQIPTSGAVVDDETESALDTGQIAEGAKSQDVEDFSKTESISEHIPSRLEYSVTESDDINQASTSHDILKDDKEVVSGYSTVIPPSHSNANSKSEQDPSKHSWNLDIQHNVHLSKESPVNLANSSDSKDTHDTKPISAQTSANEKEEYGSEEVQQSEQSKSQEELQKDEPDSPEGSLRSEYLDSLNEDITNQSHLSNEHNDSNNTDISKSQAEDSPSKSGSEEIIKLDIRGHGVPKFPIQAAKIIFGPPPEGSTMVETHIEEIPAFPILTPFIVGEESVQIEEVFDHEQKNEPQSPDKSPVESMSSDKTEKDLLVEEMTVENTKEKEFESTRQAKSSLGEEMASLSTLTTDYKTICEEYEVKLTHFEDAITRRDELIEELTVSLQRSVRERDQLRSDNDHLVAELQNLQHIAAERPCSDHDTIKAQISDYIHYQTMAKDETKISSAETSGATSIHSSNGERDIDREEITVNYSKSDLRSSETDFENGFETKIVTLLNKFEEYIEENLRNKLRESIIQVLCDEIGKMRIDYDTEIKDLESQLQQDKQSYSIETRRLRELLSAVKAGNADIDALREELSIKHDKEMENLRTYFEKKCTDLERSYSEEVWRGRACVSPPGSPASECADAAAGDCRRRTRSAEFPSLTFESTPMEQVLKQMHKKFEQQLEDLRSEHLAYVNELQSRHGEVVASLEEQLVQLKAHIQTAEGNVSMSMYQQDIDLELEKGDIERKLQEVRHEVLDQVQEQINVLLSDPDAELSNWPLELVALRDKIHGDAARANPDKDVASLREEGVGETDKWRQRRNNSFDQNRQLEEVTKERDALQRVATTLQRAVGQLVAYCASAEDELNRTVLGRLLATLLPHHQSFEENSQPTSADTSVELDVSRGRHVHFAPELDSILAALDEEGAAGFLRHQRDLSADIKRELEHSLRRLRHEAHELLDLSVRLAANKGGPQNRMLESSRVEVTELEEDIEDKQRSCDNCELHKKTMEEAMAECLQRESLLRSDLEAAMMKIAQLMNDRGHSSDVIAEGYGTCAEAGARRGAGASRSLDDASPRTQLHVVARDLELMQRERDDLHQQLEAANRQLRSTRQFVEEQAAEREHERDEFAHRLTELRDENSRLAARLLSNARILAEVEQLETQTREMNQMFADLESRKAITDEELKSSEEKVSLLRDIIANLESQLEQKTKKEAEVLEQLETMKKTIDERDSKMRAVLGELESLRSEKVDQSGVTCETCDQDEDKYAELMEKIKEQCGWLEAQVHARTRLLQQAHEQASACCSEPSEDVSLRDHKNAHLQELAGAADGAEWVGALGAVRDAVQALTRAEDAALKRVADLRMQRDQLRQVAQEVRAERDVLQARMSEQALRISSLSARLTRQRHDADALAHAAHGELGVRLHDATAEVQRLKEELESKDKQLARLKQNLEEKGSQEQHVYVDSCNVKEKIIALERELAAAQQRTAQMQAQLEALAADNGRLNDALVQRDRQLRDLAAAKMEDDDQNQRSEPADGKTSARTLSDVVSISEFDEQDLQMRRAELKAQNMSLAGALYPEHKDKSLNRTMPPDLRPNMSSLNIDEHFDMVSFTPRADSLPAHLTSTQNRDGQYKRNVNETTVFGKLEKFLDKHSPQNIVDNCSLYPNRDISDSKNISVEPKKINFSLETSDNKTREEDITSLRELGITQENFPNILSQLKYELKKSRSELEDCKSNLKNAEEQLCEFPALKEEVEKLKGLLENTMATMANDKKFYENQLETFSSNKKLLEQRLAEMTQEVTDKSKDLHLLKEDILRRENMVLELAKEKRNLANKLSELEVKVDELQKRNEALQKYDMENHQMRERIKQLEKLEQLVSEKNQQIDSLNQHLDRLDDLQRCLHDKTEELDNLKEELHEKTNELYQMQANIAALNQDMDRVNEEKNQLNNFNKELKQKMTKLEKEQENASLRLQNSENELERVNSMNSELMSKIEELKNINDKLKDKETEIEMLNEDINAYHNEISSLKEQLQMVSRSPSPKSKGEDERKTPDRQACSDRKQLAKIKKQISWLQHELDFNKKELNDKAFELAKAKLDVSELKNSAGQAAKQAAEQAAHKDELQRQVDELRREIQQLADDKQQLTNQLEVVVARLREETNVGEIKAKLREKVESCHELEMELHDMRDMVDRRALSRSPTAELERALRDQLHYSHALDEHIMDQILSGSSDEHEEIPRLALNTSKSSSSIHSTSSERVCRLRAENDRLRLQLEHLEARMQDKDALIAELNRIRDKLVQDWQTAKLRYEAERDNSGRLQLLLDSHKDTAESLQNQDLNMIQILKKRLESAMQSEAELLEREQRLRRRVAELEAGPAPNPAHQAQDTLRNNMETMEKLKAEVAVLKSKLEAERGRGGEVQVQLQVARLQLEERTRAAADLRAQLVDLKRLKHEAGVELLRSKELLNTQGATIAELERKLSVRKANDSMTEIESPRSELAREIATLRKCLASEHPEVASLRADRQRLQNELHQLQVELQALRCELDGRSTSAPAHAHEDKDQAIRYLHGRCLRLESWRKALVWQKRYLQRVLAGYAQVERSLAQPRESRPTGKKLFKCVVTVVVTVLRMGYLVRRRQAARRAAACLLRADEAGVPTADTCTPRHAIGTPLESRRVLARRLRLVPTPAPQSPLTPLARHAPQAPQTPHSPNAPFALHTPHGALRGSVTSLASRTAGDEVRKTPCGVNTPRTEFYLLSQQRGDVANAYLNKLETVSRCLSQALESPRDVP
ncbi:golgin subfamily A member 4-like isoform X2 [Battus philenor]|uniref:golgin subfamily A member 4-like isoform X2 n=1 Tax=Battus philenor TaxID=42288 RepID=UPI0035CF7C3D